MLLRRLTALSLLLSIFLGSLPLFPQKAEAQFIPGVPNPVIILSAPTIEGLLALSNTQKGVQDTKENVESAIDRGARIAAQIAIERLVASTVSWAQSGFEGNPAYVTAPQKYFTDLADGIAGQFVQGSKLAFLCSPFQANIKLSIVQHYYQPDPFQCTMTGVAGNIESFLNDFGEGGWDKWFEFTQVPTNNPYGAYIGAKVELDKEIRDALGLEKDQLDWSQGFMSWSSCLRKNEADQTIVQWNPETEEDEIIPNPNHVPGRAVGECIARGETKTPGSIIKSQLDKVLPSGLEKLITVEHIDQLVEAFAVGIFKRYVFGDKGLFDKTSPIPASSSGSDIDGDGIPDGLDTNGDGALDVCYYGGTTTLAGPPCKGSGGGANGGPQCEMPTDNAYGDVLGEAMDNVLEERPDVGNLPNIEGGGRANARLFLSLVVDELESMGYNATDDVLNGNNNPNTGDLIAVWRAGEDDMERFDAIIGSAPTIREAATVNFVGAVPLNCTASGGGHDCSGCTPSDGSGSDGGNGSPGTLTGAPVQTTYPYNYQICEIGPVGAKQGNGPGVPGVVGNRIDPKAVIWDENPEVANWEETARLYNVKTFGPNSFDVTFEYDKAIGSSVSWPQITVGNKAMTASLWIIVWRDGAWHASTFDSLAKPNQIKGNLTNLFRGDGTLKGKLGNFNPINTQTYGFAISTPVQGEGGVNERSQILTLTWNEPVCRVNNGGGEGGGEKTDPGF